MAPSFRPAAIFLIAALGACDGAGQRRGFDRATYRADAIESCSTGMRMGGAAGEVAERICGCGADRVIVGKSDSELQGLPLEELQGSLRAAVQICLQQARDLGPLPVGTARSAPPPAESNEISPSPPPIDVPDVNSSLPAGTTGPDAGPSRADGIDVDRNDVNTTRWRQPPR